MNKAFEDVMAERRRQVEAEGFDVAHDDGHGEGDLALAGSCYARYAATRNPVGPYGYPGGPIPKDWPWSINWWKSTEKRRDLVKAAALLLAEIERLDRAAGVDLTASTDDLTEAAKRIAWARHKVRNPHHVVGTAETFWVTMNDVDREAYLAAARAAKAEA